jgi:hypothetical protein
VGLQPRSCYTSIERATDVVNYFDRGFGTGVIRKPSGLATQPELGILPERGHQLSAARPADTVPNGAFVNSPGHDHGQRVHCGRTQRDRGRANRLGTGFGERKIVAERASRDPIRAPAF